MAQCQQGIGIVGTGIDQTLHDFQGRLFVLLTTQQTGYQHKGIPVAFFVIDRQ